MPDPAPASPGGVNPSIRLSVAASNGSCGVMKPAKVVDRIMTRVTAAAPIATGDVRNE
jgi:hypothetical protein